MIVFSHRSSIAGDERRTVVHMTDTDTTTPTPTPTPTPTNLDRLVDTHLEAYTSTDVGRRRLLVEQVWHPDGRLIDPPFDGAGHDGIMALADAVTAHYPGHVFRRTTGIDAHHDSARYGWALVATDGTVAATGIDVIDVAPDGRLVRVVGFFGDLPPVA